MLRLRITNLRKIKRIKNRSKNRKRNFRRKMKVMLRILVAFILFFSVCSCQNDNEKVVMTDVENKWKKDDFKSLDFDIKDAQDPKNIVFVIRNNNDYPYSNLRLIAKI